MIAFLAIMSTLGYLIVGLAVVKVVDTLAPNYTREYGTREPELGVLGLAFLFWPYAVFMLLIIGLAKAIGLLLTRVVGK